MQPASARSASSCPGLMQELVGMASEVIGTIISADVPLMAAGLDSIAATELATQMGARLHTELP